MSDTESTHPRSRDSLIRMIILFALSTCFIYTAGAEIADRGGDGNRVGNVEGAVNQLGTGSQRDRGRGDRA